MILKLLKFRRREFLLYLLTRKFHSKICFYGAFIDGVLTVLYCMLDVDRLPLPFRQTE